jgi:predicted Zn-dependent protease
LVVAQAGAGRRDAAKATLEQVAGGEPARLLQMLQGLHDVAGDAPVAVQKDLATLQLEVVQRLRPSAARLTSVQQSELDRVEAAALTASGRGSQAVALYERLARQRPDDAQVQTEYAELLVASDDRQSLAAALAQWRAVLRRSRPQSPGWFDAKYGVAMAHYRLGQKDEAAQIIQLLLAVHQELGGMQQKRRFLDLLERCQE